jgi:hypothetical protein
MEEKNKKHSKTTPLEAYKDIRKRVNFTKRG